MLYNQVTSRRKFFVTVLAFILLVLECRQMFQNSIKPFPWFEISGFLVLMRKNWFSIWTHLQIFCSAFLHVQLMLLLHFRKSTWFSQQKTLNSSCSQEPLPHPKYSSKVWWKRTQHSHPLSTDAFIHTRGEICVHPTASTMRPWVAHTSYALQTALRERWMEVGTVRNVRERKIRIHELRSRVRE